MMKKAILLTVLFLVILAWGCGVKAPPVPPDVLVPEAVSDLKVTVKEGALYLTWSLPEENIDGSTPVDLRGFLVTRRDETGGCPECPGDFVVKAELDLRDPHGYLLEDDTVTWKDSGLTKDVIYMYKIIGVNHWGYQGPPSNQVMITWGETKE
jgi:hypothetical protein